MELQLLSYVETDWSLTIRILTAKTVPIRSPWTAVAEPI